MLKPATRLKWGLFRLLEKLNDLRAGVQESQLILPAGKPTAALWIFVSTIGELNAIDPLLRSIVARNEHLQLVLLTDRPHYRDIYLSRYPQAIVAIINGHSHEAARLAERYPPEVLIVAEIPCWPGDAPCRFPFAFLYEAKRRGARAAVVNGWLYHYPPSCRMDAIERRLFQRDYLGIFDRIAVQTDEVHRIMLAAGAPAGRLAVTGNIKFDALPPADWSPDRARSPVMLSSLIDSGRASVVCGCVTDQAEQEMILDAFSQLRESHPEVLLILAPRHPEFPERMQELRDLLVGKGIPALFRSTLPDAPVPNEVAALVLDTIGELRDFYAAAIVSHVGKDHNVLEPLGFNKPVTVGPGWEATYPSYPVYRLLLDSGCLLAVNDAGELAQTWLDMFDSSLHYQTMRQRISEAIAQARGAVARHLELIEPLFNSSATKDGRHA